MKTRTKGGKFIQPSEAILHTLGTDGRITGSVAGGFTHTWWYSNGRHNLYRDLDLPEDVAKQFIAEENTKTFGLGRPIAAAKGHSKQQAI
jgi:hypothetical protein